MFLNVTAVMYRQSMMYILLSILLVQCPHFQIENFMYKLTIAVLILSSSIIRYRVAFQAIASLSTSPDIPYVEEEEED